jgi:type IV pilus assembly protein PilA
MKVQPKQRNRSFRSARGFSLIELLIVVAVILTIAAIAIPNFIRSKMRANEAATVSNLRTISTAEVVYSTTYGIGFSSNLAKLGPPPGGSVLVDANNAGLIDDVLAAAIPGSGGKTGYTFNYNVAGAGNTTYTVNADPLNPGTTGQNYFFVDQTSVIKRNISAKAGPGDPPIS